MTIPIKSTAPEGYSGRGRGEKKRDAYFLSPLYNEYYKDTYKPAGISRWNWQKFQDSRMRWIRTYGRIGRIDLAILAFIEWSDSGGYIRQGYEAKQ